jgi:medium-chain acyl-[acyl-carrier-protein] hydrolase
MGPAQADDSNLVWTESYKVRAAELDPTGSVSPVAVCNYLQETAGAHAHALGWSVEQLLRGGLTWVLARLHVVFWRYPRWREPLAVTTWPSGALRAFALREFHISDGAGDELGVATSAWLLVDALTRRPRRPPAEIIAMAERTPARVLDDTFAHLAEGTAATDPRRSQIGYSDLDVNGHTNNVTFVRAALDAVPAAILEASELSELELEFRAEANVAEVMHTHVTNVPGDSGLLDHRLLRASDHGTLVLARSRWRPRR